MGLFDQYGGVKKHGYQIYKKNCILIEKKLGEKVWPLIEQYFSTSRNDFNLAFYLGDNGLSATYTNYYCSKENLGQVETIIKSNK